MAASYKQRQEEQVPPPTHTPPSSSQFPQVQYGFSVEVKRQGRPIR